MFMMMMQMDPELLSVLGGGHRQITREMERIEKYKELKVCKVVPGKCIISHRRRDPFSYEISGNKSNLFVTRGP